MREFWSGLLGSVIGVVTTLLLLGVAGAFALSTLAASLIGDSAARPGAPLPASSFTLEVDLRGPLAFRLPERSISPAQALSHVEILHGLETARNDARIESVLVLVGDSSMRAGHGDEIAAALARLSTAGKPVIAHVQNDEGSRLQAFAAIAGADEIHANPLGVLRSELADNFMPSRADTPSSALQVIADARGLPLADVRQLFAGDAITMAQARQSGLVDQLGTAQSVRQRLQPGDGAFVGLARYGRLDMPPASRDQIALIMISGWLTDAAMGAAMNADSITAAIDEAVLDPRIAAIILRIDSHQGEPTAGEQVASAVRRAQDAGKPVIVSVGWAASSGAYYAAAAADRIVMAARSGLGALTGPPGPLVALGQSQSDSVEDRRADAIIFALAQARDLPESRVRALVEGGALTGAEAVDYGLADQVGGLYDAVAQARNLAGLAGDESGALVNYPRPPGQLETVLDRLSELISPQERPEAARR